MKFYVSYFGCRSNQAEIQEWIVELENAGYQLTPHMSEADFGILNTCSVTQKAERDVFKFIRKIYKQTNTPWIITGCSVVREGGRLKEKYKNYIFLDNPEKQNLVETIRERFPSEDNIIYHSAFRSRIFLKIHDGCNFRCAFCVVPHLRGKSVSLPAEEVVEKARYYAALGYREIVLTGINLSSYGYDLFPRENLLNLVKQLHTIKSIDFIRLSSLDPRYLKYHFIKELSYLDRIADSFHLSFQSGSNTVLKNMKRFSKTYDYRKILDYLQHFFPAANLGADFIVGFPEESEREHRETVDFINESPLHYLHIFPFSPREGTKAALKEQVPQNVVQKRLKDLQELNRNRRLAYRETFINRTVDGILIEENQNYCLVITSNFLTVRIPPIRGYKKRKLKVLITRVQNDNMCEGEVVPNQSVREIPDSRPVMRHS
jgi:threonylcarbamoyladenosine tRNA methylthiotransferase MtaB